MPYREERSFSIEVSLVAEFDDAYEGEEDGFAWFERFDPHAAHFELCLHAEPPGL